MKVMVHFLETYQNDTTARSNRIVDAEFLADAMDAIEYNKRNDPHFRWTPHRELQIKLIQDALPEMYVDPLQFSWPFRRAVIEDMTQSSGDTDERGKTVDAAETKPTS